MRRAPEEGRGPLGGCAAQQGRVAVGGEDARGIRERKDRGKGRRIQGLYVNPLKISALGILRRGQADFLRLKEERQLPPTGVRGLSSAEAARTFGSLASALIGITLTSRRGQLPHAIQAWTGRSLGSDVKLSNCRGGGTWQRARLLI